MSSREEVLDLCVFIARENKLKCAPKQKFKFAAMAAVALVVGVVVGGPRGLDVGMLHVARFDWRFCFGV